MCARVVDDLLSMSVCRLHLTLLSRELAQLPCLSQPTVMSSSDEEQEMKKRREMEKRSAEAESQWEEMFQRAERDDPGLKAVRVNELMSQATLHRMHSALRLNTHVVTLNLTNSRLGDEVQMLASLLVSNGSIKVLTLGHCKLGEKGAVVLAAALQQHRMLRTLQVGYNDIKTAGVVALCEAAAQCKSLRILSLCGNPGVGSTVGANALVSLLHSSRSLKKLNIGECNLNGNLLEYLVTAVKANASLLEIDLSGNVRGCDATRAISLIASLLVENPTLLRIGLDSICIDDRGCRILVEALKQNSTLTSLSIRDIVLGNARALAVAELLSSNNTLTEVDMRNTPKKLGMRHAPREMDTRSSIGVLGLAGLATAMLNNRCIVKLEKEYIYHQGDLEQKIISASLLRNRSAPGSSAHQKAVADLAQLQADKEGIDRVTSMFIDALVLRVESDEPSLTSVQVEGNEHMLTDAQLQRLCTALSSSSHVSTLDLSCPLSLPLIGDGGFFAVASLLCNSHTLTCLKLDCSLISREGTAALSKALRTNRSLISLQLSNCDVDNHETYPLAAPLEDDQCASSLPSSSMSHGGLFTLATLLCNSNTLTSLKLDRIRISGDHFTALSQALLINRSLISLQLSNSKVDDNNHALASALGNEMCTHTLKYVNLQGNQMGASDVAAFAKAMLTNQSVVKLDGVPVLQTIRTGSSSWMHTDADSADVKSIETSCGRNVANAARRAELQQMEAAAADRAESVRLQAEAHHAQVLAKQSEMAELIQKDSAMGKCATTTSVATALSSIAAQRAASKAAYGRRDAYTRACVRICS
jgi:Ran GTPase-activating protein (RanGAP) involved in mRNA processing and transport